MAGGCGSGPGPPGATSKAKSVWCILPDDYDADLLEAVLHENYGLTPSEIRTAVGVLSYSGLAAVAEHTGVSVETVRFHMKRVFSKTGTRRQSELVRVIANDLCCIDPAMPPGDGP